MATITTETWTGSNGAAWPAQWTTGSTPTGASATIQSNVGRLVCGSTGGYAGGSRVARRISTNAADVVVTVKFRFPGTEVYPQIWLRSTNTALDTQGGYVLELDRANSNWSVGKRSSYSHTALSSNQSFTFTSATWYWVKFGVVGSSVKAKVWADGGSEPGWQYEVTDTTHTASAPYGFSVGVGNVGSGQFEIDDFTAEDTFGAVSGSATGVAATVTVAAPVGAATGGGTVTGLAAASTAAAPVGAATGGSRITGLAATSTAAAPIGSVTGGGTVTGLAAASTASAPVGSATGGSTVSGVVATATAAALTGALAFGYAITGAAASVSVSAPAGAVTGGAEVTGVTAASTAAALAGSTGSGTSVSGVVATSTASAPVGTVTGGSTVAGVAAHSTAAALAGSPDGGAGTPASVAGVTATSTATALAGTVKWGQTVHGVVATVETIARNGQVHGIAMLAPDYTIGVPKVIVVDDEFTPIGEIMDWRALSFISELDDIGEWSLEVDMGTAAADLLGRATNPGGGIRIQRNGTEEFSGPIWHRNRSMGSDTAQGILTVGGPSHTWQLARRLVYPNPAVNPDDYTGASPLFYRVGPTNAESIIRDLVNKNVSTSAPLTARRAPELTVAANTNLGATFTSPKYRFTPLIEALQQLSPLSRTGDDRSTDLHFRVAVVNRALQFQVFRATDRTLTARFSFDRGTLESAEWTEAGHTANFAIAGAGNVEDTESTARVAAALFTTERTDPWYPGRTETFVDVGEVNPDEADAADQINQQLTDALESGAGSYGANITPRIGEFLQYGRDFALGDFVSVELPDLEFTAPIRQVAISYDADKGEQIEISVGTADGAYSRLNPGTYRRYADLAKKLRKLKTIK